MELTDDEIYDLAEKSFPKDAFRMQISLITFARAVLATHNAGAQEPVAWRYQSEDPLDGGEWLLSDTKPNRRNIQPLYTHPQPMPQTDAARDTTRLNALEAGVEVCRHVNPDYWTSRRVGHPWGKTKHADLRSAIDAEIERLDRAKGE